MLHWAGGERIVREAKNFEFNWIHKKSKIEKNCTCWRMKRKFYVEKFNVMRELSHFNKKKNVSVEYQQQTETDCWMEWKHFDISTKERARIFILFVNQMKNKLLWRMMEEVKTFFWLFADTPAKLQFEYFIVWRLEKSTECNEWENGKLTNNVLLNSFFVCKSNDSHSRPS